MSKSSGAVAEGSSLTCAGSTVAPSKATSTRSRCSKHAATDTSAVKNADDIAARELRARMADPDCWGTSNATGGCTEGPPF
ncbi:hypothetical protein AB0B12_12200 [Streptomyces sp. NPDC044780]|uniref:hypothetical protein n=1 Tax=Streptomyces sp. NPDC044780 TaxID=3157199 RepID=UPI0033E382DE